MWGSQVPEKMSEGRRPFRGVEQPPRSGLLLFCRLALALSLWSMAGVAIAGDGASDALFLRLHAEREIAKEEATGHEALAGAMREVMHGLLVEYVVTRDETVVLDTVDAAFVRDQVAFFNMKDEPGVAWALEVFAGQGMGYERMKDDVAQFVVSLRMQTELEKFVKGLRASSTIGTSSRCTRTTPST